MKSSVFLLFFGLQIVNGQPVNDTAKKKVFIIGVIHAGNKVYNVDSLYNVLSRIGPQTIFTEQNATEKERAVIKIASFVGFVKHPVEYNGTRKFRQYNKEVKEVDFDIAFPDRGAYAKKLTSREIALWARINDLLLARRFSDADRELILKLDRLRRYVFSFAIDSTLTSMNRRNLNDSVEKMYFLNYRDIGRIVTEYKEMAEFAAFIKEEDALWKTRNEQMAANILQEIKLSGAKVSVIITGLYHKYYLTKLLSENQEKDRFVLMDGWWGSGTRN